MVLLSFRGQRSAGAYPACTRRPGRLDSGMFEELMQVIRTLRRRCPWDRKQTVASTRPLVLNEAFELDEALRRRDRKAIAEELGDYLFMGLFLACVLRAETGLRLEQSLETVVAKLKRRHPHVYGRLRVSGADEVLVNWERLKRGRRQRRGLLEGVPVRLPALQQAQLIQERCQRVGFDWKTAGEVLVKVQEEVGELESELRRKRRSRTQMAEELGDLLFAVVNLCRHLDVDAEGVLKDANRKFRRRFEQVEREFQRAGRNLADVPLEEMERAWQRAKRRRPRRRH
uniref:Nucleoside triphosphate pyrophosphohydrolase n=1 Tax=candidate division WOR-3 bacterium TaxID=2052148 RepID=A0A7C4GG48_UNCW3